MECPSCKRENPAGSRFCLGCGSELSQSCPACGQGLPPDAAFCNACGHSLAQEAPEPEQPLAVPSPTSLASGRYRVQRFLGEGAKKRVYLARDTRLDRDVALGLLKIEGLDPESRARLQREAQAMGALGGHPHVATIHDIGEESGQPFIVMEYMAQGSVAKILEESKEPLPLWRTLEIAKAVCRALEFIHGHQLIHRDLKPGNIFLAEDGTPKIGDFGLAAALDRTRLTQESAMMGTPNYMPPEQPLGGEVTPRSDLYSLGGMLYEMVTGRPVFTGDSPTAVISQHVNTPPVAPSWHTEHCPPTLEGLILRLLAKAPEDRPESATEVLAVLERVDPDEKSDSHSGSGANPLDRLARGVFVGRQAELEGLRSAMDRAVSGQGNIAMLVGEPGSGKTRTSMELETYARMRGSHVLVGRTHESEGMPSYWPWIEVGRAYGSNHDLGELNLPAGTAEELVRIFPELNVEASPALDDPEAAQFRLFDSYTGFIRAITEQKPLLIVLDDLHWADKPSLLLLQHLARSLPRMRLLVVGTYRDTDLVRTHPLSEALASLNREAGFDRIALRGLSRAEVGSYIRAAAHIEPPPALVERIHDETEGNPFFLSEVVNLMAQEGTLTAGAYSEIALPDGVKEALGRRLDRLSAEANELLQVAAVAGREFRHETLALLGDRSEDELFELLEEGLAARVIEETGAAGQYRFTHALMQETLLDELSTTRRVRLHGRIGEALEQRWGERADERATRLAQHFVEAATLTERHAEKAMRYSKLAADRAETQAGWGEAARRYADCLTLLTETEAVLEGDQAELLVKIGVCHRNANAARDAWRSLNRAFDLFRERGDGVGVARAAYEASPINAPPERQARLLVDAIEQLGDADPHLEARLHAALLHPRFRGQTELDRDLHREAAAKLADRHDLADVKAHLLNAAADDASYAYRDEEALRLQMEAHNTFDTLGLVREAAETIFQASLATQVGATPAQMKAVAEDALAYARRYHLPYFEENSAANVANALLLMADFEALDRLFEEQAGAATWTTRVAHVQRELLRGNVEEARAAMPTPELVRGIPSQEAIIHAYRARVFAAAGETAAARKEFSRVLELEEPRYSSLVILRDLVFQFADPDSIRAWFEKARRATEAGWRRPRSFTASGSSAREFFGHLALAVGEEADAEEAFRTTLEWAEREDAPIIAGQCHQGLADVALRRAETDEAREHLDAAAKLFQDHNAKLYLDQVIAKKMELQGASASDLETSIAAVATSVSQGRPDLTLHASPDGSVTLVFSDMEDYTGMLERLGDLAAHQLVQSHNAIVREQTALHGGHEVELRGDGFLLAFGSAQKAVQCAMALQRTMAAYSAEHPEQPIRIRVGLHTGEAIKDADKFFGKSVVQAFRVADLAQGSEILVSSLTHDLVESTGDGLFDEGRDVELKGLEGTHRVFSVRWE